jgi:hypothetical protein
VRSALCPLRNKNSLEFDYDMIKSTTPKENNASKTERKKQRALNLKAA